METTQINLLCAVRDGQDTQAWDRFYRIYAGMVANFTRRLGLPEADAEDVTQEVLIAAHRSLRDGVYDPARGRFRNWFYGIVRRQTLAKMRERRRRTRAQWVSQRGEADLLDRLADPKADDKTAALWQQEWRYALLDEALRHVEGQIGEKAFQAFTLYAIERQPVEQVAGQLGIAPASVYVYKGRVLSAIRDWIEQFDRD